MINFQGRSFPSSQDESVLDTLLKNDVDIPYACKAGVCQVCVMQCKQGELPQEAVSGLQSRQVADNNFLACQCFPENDITIDEVDAQGVFIEAIVEEKTVLSSRVCRIRLSNSHNLVYRAGQFINVKASSGDIRSYSLASLPKQDNYLELHVKCMKNGVVSNWLFNDVSVGDKLNIQGPYGDCFYRSEDKLAPMLMIATGTGLTPLLGIFRDAIEQGHEGPISLYHGERTQEGLYLNDTLKKLASRYSQFSYYPCVSSGTDGAPNDGVYSGRASDMAFEQVASLATSLVYLCGSPSMVTEAGQHALQKNARKQFVFSDPFFTKDLRRDKNR